MCACDTHLDFDFNLNSTPLQFSDCILRGRDTIVVSTSVDRLINILQST